MGERKGQNKYYPPDFDYKVHKSLSGYHGQHALRERARKLDQGILIIRFEMPYNIWCDGCNNHVGMGVRYNAEKSKIGNYYTTPIFKFRMKCHLCSNHFEIKTDPANHDYVIISGARRKEQRWDPHENEQIVPEDRDNQKKLVLDSMYKLEHSSNDLDKAKSAIPRLAQLIEQQSSHKDDFELNQLARKKLRESKKAAKISLAKDDELKNRLGLSIDLLPESERDIQLAKIMKLSSVKSQLDVMKEKKKGVDLLFGPSSSKPGPKCLTSKGISLQAFSEIVGSKNKRKRSEAFDTDIQSSSDAKPNNSFKLVHFQAERKPSETLSDAPKKETLNADGKALPNNGSVGLVANYECTSSSDSD